MFKIPFGLVFGLLLVSSARAALVNVAQTGTASASSQGFGTVAADGNDGNRNGNYAAGSVFHTTDPDGNMFWQVALGGTRFLDHIRIFNRTDAVQGSVGNFRIIARNGGAEVFNQIFLPVNQTDQNSAKAWGTSALRGIQADTVRIERVSQASPRPFMTFAEFEVWGSTAALAPHIAPVNVSGSPAGFGSAVADANDGDINGNFFGPGVPAYQSISAGIGQFWEMDLGTDFLVKSLQIFNRTDAATTSNVKVSLLNEAGATAWTQNLNISQGSGPAFNYGFELEPNLGARRVRIETLGSENLALAEVKAFGTALIVFPPVVDNQPATNVQATTATLAATVTSTGFEAPAVKIYYGTSDGGTTPANWASSVDLGLVSGAASANVSGLQAATGHFFRAFAQNSAGSDWADTSGSFTTQAVLPPAIEIVPAIGMTGHTALLNGRILATGNDKPQVTVYWGTGDGGTSSAGWTNAAPLGLQDGPFGHWAANLQPSTTYHFRASAANGVGTVWSPALSFVTTTKPPVVINEIHYEPNDNTRNIEFIEIWNPSVTAVDIAGWTLADAVEFTFPAGTVLPADGYRVIAANAAAFQAFFGFAPAGQWSGQLRNSGAQIQLRDAGNVKIDDVDYAPGFPWPTGAAGGGPSIELISPALENDVGGAWRSAVPTGSPPRPQTPGAKNSVYSVLAPPAVRTVSHTPNEPAANQPVTITATVDDRNGLGTVSLLYQTVTPGAYIRKTDASFATSWTALPMHDDGLDGDAAAGDAIFTAVIPESVQVHRRLVRYRIMATDGLGVSVTVPYTDDEQPNFAYFVYDGVPAWSGAFRPGVTPVQNFPADVVAAIPPWHLIANGTDVSNSQYNGSFNDVRFPGTLVYDGKVYDHVQFKNRGIGSTYVSGKNKWALYFNRARNLEARDNWGRRYNQTWNSMSMDACSSPWCAVHRGCAGVDEAVGYRVFELAGIPALRTHYIHWRVIDQALEASPSSQYEGDLWGLYMALEPTEGNLLDERNLPDGNIYSIEGGGGDKKHQAASQSADSSDWNTFRSGANQGGQTEAWYRANVDLPALFTFFALSRYSGNVDIRGGDNYRFYHRSTDNRWVIMPYDMDMMFLPGHHWSASIDGVTYAGVTEQFRAITRHAAIARDFRNRARELLDLLGADGAPNGGQFGQLIDEYAQMVNPAGAALTWADLDAAMWNFHPQTAGSGAANSNNDYTNHKGNFFRTPYFDHRGVGGVPTTNWTRTLPDPDNNGYSDFEGSMTYFTEFGIDTFPAGLVWTRSNGNQKGYGYKYLEWESLYGGLGLNPATPDLSFPNRPAITYTGPAGYPANALDFASSAFSPAASGGTTFAALQWRIGEIYAPGVPGYVTGEPRVYEVEEVWTSAESTSTTVRVPLSAARPGHTYRARVRHKDANGGWSRWSEAVQYVTGTPDVSVFQQSIVISEINYHPSAVTLAESGWMTEDFEWIEVKNVSAVPLDCTGLRFTKGVDFDFPDGFMIAAGGFALVVKNLAAFQARYGHGFDTIIAGTFPADNLSNGGEEVKLSYGAGTPVREFVYDDFTPWPGAATDGDGFTLVLRDPTSRPDHAIAGNWRASCAFGGSPGADDVLDFACWAAKFLEVPDPNADNDGDGIVNRLEYAFGGDPLQPSSGLLPTGAIASLIVGGNPAADYLIATIRRPTGISDLTYTAEFSTDLADWTGGAALVSSTNNGDGTITDVWRSPNPVSSHIRWFVRVTVQ